MNFHVGETAFYQNKYLCMIEEDDHTHIPYYVRFLTDGHPDEAVYLIISNGWYTWCRPDELFLAEDEEPLTITISLSEVL